MTVIFKVFKLAIFRKWKVYSKYSYIIHSYYYTHSLHEITEYHTKNENKMQLYLSIFALVFVVRIYELSQVDITLEKWYPLLRTGILICHIWPDCLSINLINNIICISDISQLNLSISIQGISSQIVESNLALTEVRTDIFVILWHLQGVCVKS